MKKIILKSILKAFGEDLLIDMNNMLNYEIITTESNINSYPIYMNTKFYIKNPNNISKKYKLNIFTIKFLSDKIYPCKLESTLTKNSIECFDKNNLNNMILEELKNEEFQKKIYSTLRIFYSEEEIKKILNE